MQPTSIHEISLKLSSRRQILVGAGSAVACLAGLGKNALAAAIVDHSTTEVTAGSFTPFIDQYVKVSNAGARPSTLKLVKVLVQPRGNRPAGLRDPFSLIFATADGVPVTSEVHQVQLPDQRRVEMFLSPISSDSSRYEAAFN